MSTSNVTVALGNRVDANLKRAFEETAEDLGLSATAALSVLMKRFVDDGGFPFAVRKKVPSEVEFAAEMDRRYERMLEGHETEHDLVEVQ